MEKKHITGRIHLWDIPANHNMTLYVTTEVVYLLIKEVLLRGERVLWATPRKDVVLELAPRLQKAFPNVSIAVLHGSSEKKYAGGDLVLCTTHQALRFYHSFDLAIVDEVDAFPFHNSDMLPFAVSRARKIKGKTVYLTATPREEHKKRMGKRLGNVDHLPHVKIPVRFHGYPIPVPKVELVPKLMKKVKEGTRIPPFLGFIKKLIQQENCGFIFLPSISLLPEVKRYIIKNFPCLEGKLETVHAADPLREEKVMAMRKGDLQVLVTTTIMERGVTISGISVLVFQADAPIFDESALVQIAGRAGRSAQIPMGDVLFLGEDFTEGMKRAVRQIKDMNHLAKKEGYLQ